MAEEISTFAHREFFERLEHAPITDDYQSPVRALIPEHWRMVRGGFWLHATDDQPIPTQGFKIHVTSTLEHAVETLRKIVPSCVETETTFKFAADQRLLGLLNSRYIERGNSGKFITIYPRTEDVFISLIEMLHSKTSGTALVGPYVLSDRRYKDSRIVSYRYGGFRLRSRLRVDGTTMPLISMPSGELVHDKRLPYFELPEGIADPFPDDDATPDGDDELLHGRYRIETALRYSNAGGTYRGVDVTTDGAVVIKEARPFTSNWLRDAVLLDACSFRRHEWDVLQRLAHLDCVPKPIDYFTEWEHSFLVEEMILDGATYWSYWASRENILAPYIRWPGHLEAFLPKFKRMAKALLATVDAIHGAGVLLGDISPRNLLVTPDFRIVVVDLDSAVFVDEEDAVLKDYGAQWHTAGYLKPGRAERRYLVPADDYYAVGMLLYCGVIPVPQYLDLNSGARDRFLDELIMLGLPAEVKQIIDALLAGEPDRARAVLDAVGW